MTETVNKKRNKLEAGQEASQKSKFKLLKQFTYRNTGHV